MALTTCMTFRGKANFLAGEKSNQAAQCICQAGNANGNRHDHAEQYHLAQPHARVFCFNQTPFGGRTSRPQDICHLKEPHHGRQN